MDKVLDAKHSSFPRKRESIICKVFWIPDQVGYDDMRLLLDSSEARMLFRMFI